MNWILAQWVNRLKKRLLKLRCSQALTHHSGLPQTLTLVFLILLTRCTLKATFTGLVAPTLSSPGAVTPPLAQSSGSSSSPSGSPSPGRVHTPDEVSFRLSHPQVIRGPFPDELDSPFFFLRTASGTVRGFTSNASVYQVTAASLSGLGPATPRIPVLTPTPAPHLSSLSQLPLSPLVPDFWSNPSTLPTTLNFWLNSVFLLPSPSPSSQTPPLLLGFFHQETHDETSQTLKTMALATSTEQGEHWSAPTTFLAGSYLPLSGASTGVVGAGDCTGAVLGQDGFLYLYCLDTSPQWLQQGLVVRALLSDLMTAPPAALWKKWYNGKWEQPALGGSFSPLPAGGAGFFQALGQVGLFYVGQRPGSEQTALQLALAPYNDGQGYTQFSPFPEPLLPLDENSWDRSSAHYSLTIYLSPLNPQSGGTQLQAGSSFLLSYVYVPQGLDFANRFLVLQTVDLLFNHPSQSLARNGVELSRWQGAAGFLRTTISPVNAPPPATGALVYQKSLGFLLTTPPPPATASTMMLSECLSGPQAPPDSWTVTGLGCPPSYTRAASLGWVFQDAGGQPGLTQPLFSCTSHPSPTFHFVSLDPQCEGLGRQQALLGYDLVD